jgi:dihydroflavonol-4-reductase
VKALVVGGTGFVGMNVVRALVAAGHEVVATRRARANTLFARKLGARLVVADLDDEETLLAAMSGRDVVFMCAGHYPRFSLGHAAEVRAAESRAATLFRTALRAKVDRVVLTSSVSTVGRPSPPRTLSTEDDPMDPRALASVYYASKWAIERQADDARARGLSIVTLCPTGIFGELDVKAGTGFLLVGLGQRRLRFYVDGRTNVVDADIVARAHVAAAESRAIGKRYIVAGHNTTIRELLTQAAEELSVPFEARCLPAWLAAPLSTLDERRCARKMPRARPLLTREFVDMARFGRWVDGSAAVRDLGLPESPPLRDTLRKAIAWYVRYRYITLPEGREKPADHSAAKPREQAGDPS